MPARAQPPCHEILRFFFGLVLFVSFYYESFSCVGLFFFYGASMTSFACGFVCFNLNKNGLVWA